MPAQTNKVWSLTENGDRFADNCKPTRGALARQEAREFANRDRSVDYLEKVRKYIDAGDALKAGLWAADLISLAQFAQWRRDLGL